MNTMYTVKAVYTLRERNLKVIREDDEFRIAEETSWGEDSSLILLTRSQAIALMGALADSLDYAVEPRGE